MNAMEKNSHFNQYFVYHHFESVTLHPINDLVQKNLFGFCRFYQNSCNNLEKLLQFNKKSILRCIRNPGCHDTFSAGELFFLTNAKRINCWQTITTWFPLFHIVLVLYLHKSFT